MESTLRESAPLALQWSQQHCRVDTEPKRDCGWYHGFWQIARVMGIGKASGGHADFLLEALREHARTGGFRRVLVSGTVDYSMPALVYQAYAMEDSSVDLTVVDWCETPLLLSRWYADRVKQPVRTVRSNILDMRESGGFDLVLTNSFLGYFTVEQRQRLFGVWADLLRPGGKAVLSNRVRPAFEAAARRSPPLLRGSGCARRGDRPRTRRRRHPYPIRGTRVRAQFFGLSGHVARGFASCHEGCRIRDHRRGSCIVAGRGNRGFGPVDHRAGHLRPHRCDAPRIIRAWHVPGTDFGRLTHRWGTRQMKSSNLPLGEAGMRPSK